MHKQNPANHVETENQTRLEAQDKNRNTTGNQRRPDDSARRGERDFNDLNRDEIIALLKKVAEELGHRPNQFEFWQMAKAKKEHMRRLFGSYRELVQEAGFEALGPGYHLTTEQLLTDWAVVARKMGKAPTVMQYNKAGKYSHRAFRMRWKSWHAVPAVVVEWATGKWPDRQWDDVAEIARKYTAERKAAGTRLGKKKYNRLTSTEETELTSTPGRKQAAGLVYGRPLVMQALATAPTNEAGVMYLFASLATALGFTVLHIQQAFPDCHAFRRGQDGLWRIVRIEFEFESRNFLMHGHDPKGCDLIVCWTHNWESCPVEVVELSKIVGT